MDPECGIADHLCVHDQIMFLHITYRSRHCWTGVALQGAGCSCDTEFLRNSQLSDARFWCTEMAIYNYDGDHHSILHFFDILYSIPLYCTSCKPCRIYTCANRVVIPRSKKTGFSRDSSCTIVEKCFIPAYKTFKHSQCFQPCTDLCTLISCSRHTRCARDAAKIFSRNLFIIPNLPKPRVRVNMGAKAYFLGQKYRWFCVKLGSSRHDQDSPIGADREFMVTKSSQTQSPLYLYVHVT